MRDSKGRFVKGHKGESRRLEPESKCLRESLRDEIIRVAASLRLPVESLNFELSNPHISRLQYFFNQKLKTGDGAFINSVIDRAIGKPHQAQPIDPSLEDKIVEDLTDDSRLADMVMKAREQKIEEDAKRREELAG